MHGKTVLFLSLLCCSLGIHNVKTLTILSYVYRGIVCRADATTEIYARKHL